MLVQVSEAGTLPSSEGVVGERYRDGEIHPDHADIHPVGEVTCRIAVAGKDGHAVPIIVLGWKPQRPLRYGLERTYAWIERQVCGCYTPAAAFASV